MLLCVREHQQVRVEASPERCTHGIASTVAGLLAASPSKRPARLMEACMVALQVDMLEYTLGWMIPFTCIIIGELQHR